MSFASQYQSLLKDVFAKLVQVDLANGAQAEAQARRYSESGKPDFALAYLLSCELPDDEKRATLARSYERRAAITLERAGEYDRKFHREFPLLHTSAAHDRGVASDIRAGKSLSPETSNVVK